MRLELFKILILETATLCNRKCPTCLRQNDPTRSRWVGKTDKPIDVRMPVETVHNIIDQAADMGFKGECFLYYYNEPLMDFNRFISFCRYAKAKGLKPGMATNADLLTPKNPRTREMAKEIDAVISHLIIDLYDVTAELAINHKPMSKTQHRARVKYLTGLFPGHKVAFNWAHLTDHFSPRKNLQELIKRHRNNPCYLTCRMIIDYRGKMLLCCEDIMANWNLGNIRESSLEELWYSPRHQKIVEALVKPGGRQNYPYCRICPLKGGVKGKYPYVCI